MEWNGEAMELSFCYLLQYSPLHHPRHPANHFSHKFFTQRTDYASAFHRKRFCEIYFSYRCFRWNYFCPVLSFSLWLHELQLCASAVAWIRRKKLNELNPLRHMCRLWAELIILIRVFSRFSSSLWGYKLFLLAFHPQKLFLLAFHPRKLPLKILSARAKDLHPALLQSSQSIYILVS